MDCQSQLIVPKLRLKRSESRRRLRLSFPCRSMKQFGPQLGVNFFETLGLTHYLFARFFYHNLKIQILTAVMSLEV